MQARSPGKAAIAHTGRTDWLAIAGVPENTHTAGSSTQVILLAVRLLSNRDARKEKEKVQGVPKTED